MSENEKKNQGTFTITNDQTGESWQFPLLAGSLGPGVIDIRQFYARTGFFTFDPSFI